MVGLRGKMVRDMNLTYFLANFELNMCHSCGKELGANHFGNILKG